MYPAPNATAQQITAEEKAGKIAKLHQLFIGCPSFDIDELRAVLEALMSHLNIHFADIEEYRESIFRAEIENHGQKLNAEQVEDFKNWLEDRHDELTKIKGFVDMADFFFDYSNSTAYEIYSRFHTVCNKYMIFPISK